MFDPGIYKLVTQTIALLTYLQSWDKLFESRFKSDVYFFSTRQQHELNARTLTDYQHFAQLVQVTSNIASFQIPVSNKPLEQVNRGLGAINFEASLDQTQLGSRHGLGTSKTFTPCAVHGCGPLNGVYGP